MILNITWELTDNTDVSIQILSKLYYSAVDTEAVLKKIGGLPNARMFDRNKAEIDFSYSLRTTVVGLGMVDPYPKEVHRDLYPDIVKALMRGVDKRVARLEHDAMKATLAVQRDHLAPDTKILRQGRDTYMNTTIKPLIDAYNKAAVEARVADNHYLSYRSSAVHGILIPFPSNAWDATMRDFGIAIPKTTMHDRKAVDKILKAAGDRQQAFFTAFAALYKVYKNVLQATDILASINPEFKVSWSHIGTKTGRYSARRFAIQSVHGVEFIRGAFIASPNKKLVGVDYDTLEMRILAALSKDDKLAAALNEGDFHSTTAERLDVDRKVAKAISFGINYGMGNKSLAKSAGKSEKEARAIVSRLAEVYPRTYAEFIPAVKDAAINGANTKTMVGRSINHNKWVFADKVESSELYKYHKTDIAGVLVKRGGATTGLSYLIQGTASDIYKKALFFITATTDFDTDEVKIKMLHHDEVIVEVDEDKAEKWAEIIDECMGRAAYEVLGETKVVFTTSYKIGDNWFNVK